MQFTAIKAVAATLWVIAIIAGGILIGIRSTSGWLLMAGIAVALPILIGRIWGPSKSMSESIGDVLR